MSTEGHDVAHFDKESGMSKHTLLEQLQENQTAHAGGGRIQQVPNSWGAAGDQDSWKDLYRILIGSLQASSAHFEALTLETMTLGLWGLSNAHASLSDDVQGSLLDSTAIIQDWLYCAAWAGALTDARQTAEQVAAELQIAAHCIIHHQPCSQPMKPAHLLAMDHSRQQLLLVVRGTSSWADVFSDLVAHTAPLGQGQAHSGMLECGNNLISHCLPLMEQQMQQHQGYRIHCVGHSLGGGVAALIAYQLRNCPSLRARLSGASGVMASGYGTPPVMTRELAVATGGYIRTLVHSVREGAQQWGQHTVVKLAAHVVPDHDLVPRACIASLAMLRAELQDQAEMIFANNKTAAWLRDSGLLEGGKTLAARVGSYAAARTTSSAVAAAVIRSPGAQRWLAAGLQVGASLLTDKLHQLHTEAMATEADAGCSTSAPVAPVAAAPSHPAAGFGFAALARQAAASVDTAAHYELVKADHSPSSCRFERIILNRSMLRDHYLMHYVGGLRKLLAQVHSGYEESLI
eukprot:gene13274-13405_t